MITITQEPFDFYPAYNNSFLKFNTAYDTSRAEITIDAEGPFTIFPALDNKTYIFNLKEIITSLINENRFADEVQVPTITAQDETWHEDDTSLTAEYTVKIKIFELNGPGNDELEKTYSFSKAVQQFGDPKFENKARVLLPSDDGVNFEFSMWRGFPFDFTVLEQEGYFRILSLSGPWENLLTIEIDSPETPRPRRFFLHGTKVPPDYVGWESLFGDTYTKTRWRIREGATIGGVFTTRANLDINIPFPKCGVYLKWFNAQGGWSYHLFDEFYRHNIAGQEINRVSANNFELIHENFTGKEIITGREGEQEFRLRTTIENEWEKRNLMSLITSPKVYLWSLHEPYNYNGNWLSVKVSSTGFTHATKHHKYPIEVIVELPEINTQTL